MPCLFEGASMGGKLRWAKYSERLAPPSRQEAL